MNEDHLSHRKFHYNLVLRERTRNMPAEPRMPVYPIYPSPVIFPWTSKSLHGFLANAIFMVEHTGTHMDAPLHFIERGRSIDGVRLDVFYGEAVVLRLRVDKKNANFETGSGTSMTATPHS